MPKSIQFIHNQRPVQIDVDEHVELWTNEAESTPGLSESDYADAVYEALQHPVDYPPAVSGVVPEDKVAIVVDAELPEPGAAVAGVLRLLAGLDVSRIDVVIAESASESTRNAILNSLPPGIELAIHSGQGRDDLSYLAANEAANPIYLNRRIVDADLVIPVMVARQADALLNSSTASPVFPALADSQSQVRARLDVADIAKVSKRRRGVADDEAASVNWLLGLQWTVVVDVNSDGEATAVHAGTVELTTALSREAWERRMLAEVADVVIACVDGGRQQQSLPNLLRAALAGRSYGGTEASIVLVSDLAELGQLVGFDDSDDGDAGTDLVTYARRMLRQLINDGDSEQRFLLLSNCDEAEVEAFGFGAVEDEVALSRLVRGQRSCAVLRNAQLAGMRE